jgi:glucan phosphoethanolaminetransferase (alkaline phosphatase superfamily)
MSPRALFERLRPRNRAARARFRERRKKLGWLVLFAPALWILGSDVLWRARRIAAFDRMHTIGYWASAALSLVLWGVLLHAASRRERWVAKVAGVVFVGLYTLAAGVEAAFRSYYNIYLSIDGQLHSKSIPWSVVGTLPVTKAVCAHVLFALAIAMGSVFVARRTVRPRPWASWTTALFAPALLAGLVKLPVSYRTIQSTVPDLIYFHGMVALVKERLGFTHDSPDLRVQRRNPEPVPALHPKPARPRNVLLVLQESQRFDVTCVEHDPKCELATRFSNKVVPNRMPLLQMRANDSTTAISISNLWSGVAPTESRDLLHSTPLMWEYAHAAGWDTAYWTSQNLMFGNARLFVQDIPVSKRAVATDLDSEADLDSGAEDRLLTDRVLAEIGELREPYFAVVHYCNNHWPYVYDPENAPFQPADLNKNPEKNDEFFNYYKDVVYLSDKAVGRLLEGVRATEAGKHTVILYTSDHGEAFREHWQLGHTSALFEEEIRVPTWIDAPKGTLAPEEEASIRGAKNELLWHLDMAPTFLDLMGVWDDPALAAFRARMIGHPITRPERTVGPVPLTNCTWLWECAFRNWGMMQGRMKIEAREWDYEYHCFDVLADPDEQVNLGEARCAPLPDLARATYHVMPVVIPPGRPAVDWGQK